jgi:hypothetical protein
MISMTLFGLAVAWLAMLARFPSLFARRRQPSVIPRYHYYVCGTEALPTWQRKTPGMAQKSARVK